MSYSFRIRMNVAPRNQLNVDIAEMVLSAPQSEKHTVTLRSSDKGKAIREAPSLVVVGKGYASSEDAEQAAAAWRSRLMAAFADIRLGVNFGDRSAKGFFTKVGLDMLEKARGNRILNDVHGIMVFESEPIPEFVSTRADAIIGKPADKFMDAVEAAGQQEHRLRPEQELAFELFGASFFENYEDARFLLLMMAVEALITPEERSVEARQHVERLIADTKAAELPAADIASLVASMHWLRYESISRAGRRLARSLDPNRYMNLPAERFFSDCYELRSNLVHGSAPRPDTSEVGVRAANLEGFVGDLLKNP